MLASARQRKHVAPLEDRAVSFWNTSSISVRASPSRSTTSTLCETSLTPDTTSVRPGTRAVMRPSPRGPDSAMTAGCALTVRCGSMATNDAVRSGGLPLVRSAVSPDKRTIACPRVDRRVSFPFSTVTEARSAPLARIITVPPTLESISAVRPASSICIGSAPAAELPSFRTTIDPRVTSMDPGDARYTALSSPRSRFAVGPRANDARAPRAVFTSDPAETASLFATPEHLSPSRSHFETAGPSVIPCGVSTSMAWIGLLSLDPPPPPLRHERARADDTTSTPRFKTRTMSPLLFECISNIDRWDPRKFCGFCSHVAGCGRMGAKEGDPCASGSISARRTRWSPSATAVTTRS